MWKNHQYDHPQPNQHDQPSYPYDHQPEAQASIVLNLLHHLLNRILIFLTHGVLAHCHFCTNFKPCLYISNVMSTIITTGTVRDLKHVVDGVVGPDKQVSVEGARSVRRLQLVRIRIRLWSGGRLRPTSSFVPSALSQCWPAGALISTSLCVSVWSIDSVSACG